MKGGDHPLLACPCVLCHTWRRVGYLLVTPGQPDDFRAEALRRVRVLHSDLLDLAEGVGLATPVAEGVATQAPASREQRGSTESQALAEASSKAPPLRPPSAVVAPTEGEAEEGPSLPGVEEGKAKAEGEAKEEGARSLSKEKKKSKKEKKKEKRKREKAERKSGVKRQQPKDTVIGDPKREAGPASSPSSPEREKEETSPARARSSGVRKSASTPARGERRERDGSQPEAREREEKRRVKEESPESGRVRERLSPEGRRQRRRSTPERGRRERGRNSPERRRSVKRSLSRSRRRERRISRTPERREGIRGGHRPPPEPAVPPRFAPPAGPPPGIFGGPYPGWGTNWWQKSKGVKRRERNWDIQRFGLDPDRKRDRVERSG